MSFAASSVSAAYIYPNQDFKERLSESQIEKLVEELLSVKLLLVIKLLNILKFKVQIF